MDSKAKWRAFGPRGREAREGRGRKGRGNEERAREGGGPSAREGRGRAEDNSQMNEDRPIMSAKEL